MKGPLINEFGLKIEPPTLAPQDYSRPRDALFRAVGSASERQGADGMLAWIAMPGLVLRPGDITLRPSTLNRYSPFERPLQPGEPDSVLQSVLRAVRLGRPGRTAMPTAAAATVGGGAPVPRRTLV
jgi:hypothetical protein